MSNKTAEEILEAMPPIFRGIATALATIDGPDGWGIAATLSRIGGPGISVRSPGGFAYVMGFADELGTWSAYSDEWEHHNLTAQGAFDVIVREHTRLVNATNAWRDDASKAIADRDFDAMEACLRQALDRLNHDTAEVARLLDSMSKMRGGGTPLERLVEILRDAYPGVGA